LEWFGFPQKRFIPIKNVKTPTTTLKAAIQTSQRFHKRDAPPSMIPNTNVKSPATTLKAAGKSR
jgi:hypothetical protein